MFDDYFFSDTWRINRLTFVLCFYLWVSTYWYNITVHFKNDLIYHKKYFLYTAACSVEISWLLFVLFQTLAANRKFAGSLWWTNNATSTLKTWFKGVSFKVGCLTEISWTQNNSEKWGINWKQLYKMQQTQRRQGRGTYLALWKKQKHSIKDNTTKIRSKTDHSAHEIGECQNKTGTKQTEHIKKTKTQT